MTMDEDAWAATESSSFVFEPYGLYRRLCTFFALSAFLGF